MAEPLLDGLGPGCALERTREVFGLAVRFWNAQVRAAEHWGLLDTKPWQDLQRACSGKTARPEDGEALTTLSQRWDELDLFLDPRLVVAWAVESGPDGEARLSCEMGLPDGLEAEVEPPREKRIAIGGKFVDQVRIRIEATTPGAVTYRLDPVETHYAEVRVDEVIAARTFEGMALRDLRLCGTGATGTRAMLLFGPKSDTRHSP